MHELATLLREQGAAALMDRSRDMEVPETDCPRHGHRPYEAECKLCALEYRRATETLAKHLADAGVPSRFKGCRLGAYRVEHEGHKRAVSAVRSVLDGIRAVAVLAGPSGTGKTLLSVAAAHEWVDAMLAKGDGRGAAVYTTARDYVDDIKASWGRDSETSEPQVVRRYTEAGLLVLDELGEGRGKPEEVYQLSHVINRRYENQRPTIVVTNYALEELSDSGILDFRALSRLRGGDVLRTECVWEDERPSQGKEAAAGE